MSASEYAALIQAVHASLNANRHYGRNGKHAFGACASCRINHCLTHPPVTCKAQS